MGQNMNVMGMVLSAMPVNDYDKRVVILTKEKGKIIAFARGARRPGSQLLAPTSPFTFGEFEVFEGKNSYNLLRADVKNYFRDLVTDLDGAYLGFYFMEFADYFCQENNDEREMLKLLYQTMRALEKDNLDNELIRVIFELRAITISGEGPNVFQCMNCGSKEDLTLFSVHRGGMFCKNCEGQERGRNIQTSTRYAMQYIIATPIEKLYTFAVSPEVLEELTLIMREYLDCYVHHNFKSLEAVSDLKKMK